MDDQLEVVLRAIEKTDLPKMKTWRNQILPFVREYRMLNDDHQERWWKDYCDQAYERYPAHLMYAIEVHTPNMSGIGEYAAKLVYRSLVGICGLCNIDWLNRRAELSLYIGPEHQRKGYGKAALKALHEIAFHQLGMHTMWVELYPEIHDAASNALVKKTGYKLAGKKRAARLIRHPAPLPHAKMCDLNLYDFVNGVDG